MGQRSLPGPHVPLLTHLLAWKGIYGDVALRSSAAGAGVQARAAVTPTAEGSVWPHRVPPSQTCMAHRVLSQPGRHNLHPAGPRRCSGPWEAAGALGTEQSLQDVPRNTGAFVLLWISEGNSTSNNCRPDLHGCPHGLDCWGGSTRRASGAPAPCGSHSDVSGLLQAQHLLAH